MRRDPPPASVSAGLERFDEADLERIRDAVSRAEGGSAAEVVVYIVRECDPYPEAALTGALIGAFAGLFLASIWNVLQPGWGVDPLFAFGLPSLAAVAGFGSSIGLPALRRALIATRTLEARARRRAEAAFLEAGVFDTRDRTGVLLFVAEFERRAIVLADEAIHELVPEEEWLRIAEAVASGMQSGDPCDAVVRGVERCGRVLADYGPAARADDADELPDEPVVGDD